MKVAVFSTQSYDRRFLDEASARDDPRGEFEMVYQETTLSSRTAVLAEGCEAVCVFVNDRLDAPALGALAASGVQTILLRCAGFNNVDLEAAKRLGLSVLRVPAYSPEGVAEHAIALIMTLNRQTYRAYNRVRDGNFMLDGLLGLTALSSREITLAGAGRELGTAASELWRPLTMIAAIMAVAFVANFSGGSSSIGLGLAETGRIFPLLSPVIGWFGVFITGSVVNGNTLFARLQSVTATQIGVDRALLVAANTSGGVMAKLISPQSIAVAAAAVGLVGSEAAIMRTTLKYSLGLLAYVCVWTLALSYLR